MPPLDEGALLYMPTTMPGISITEAQTLLQVQDRIIRQFPEVDRVLGKAGRADTQHRPGAAVDAGDGHHAQAADPSGGACRHLVLRLGARVAEADLPAAHAGSTSRPRNWSISSTEALKLPGVSNAWTMPIKARIDMLTTGIRTPLGLKISGDDLQTIEDIGTQIEAALPAVHGTRNVFAERTGGGYFLDFEWNRDELARYGLSMDEAQSVVQSAIGGENVTTTVEGRERYPVNVRYMRDFRSDLDALGRVLVPASGGARQIPLSQLADAQGRHRTGHDSGRRRPADRLRVRGRGRP